MAQIHGQVESLKKLKSELRSKAIYRFNSIKEINDFLKNMDSEKEEILNNQREILQNEVSNLRLKIKEYSDECEKTKRVTLTEIEIKSEAVRVKIENLSTKTSKGLFYKILYSYSLNKHVKLLDYYRNNSAAIIANAVKYIQEITDRDEKKLKHLIEDHESIIKERSLKGIQNLNHIKKVIDELQPLIAGAIGESLVVKEIGKLPDDYILINDYSLKFNPPIYNRNTKDRIFSIQIDHLLISKSGIYILETKNWSKKSIESLDLRSPVEQITRTSYALFLLVNDAKIRLTEHHWGEKQIPIKNVIVMINEKTKEEFKHVKVKTLKELNTYLTYFEPVFTHNEVDRIAKYLIRIQN